MSMGSPDDSPWARIYDLADEPGEEASSSEGRKRGEASGELVAMGGMKKIYRHYDSLTGREIARAVLRDPDSEMMRERFVREARILAHLEHPNIVPLHSIELEGEEGPAFTMKLVRGRSLQTAIEEGQLEESEYVDVFAKVCDAVSFAHSEGILHLDLKPDNIQLGDFGEVLVCDWGLAGFVDRDDWEEERFYESDPKLASPSEASTRHGELRGTPGFLAPEQAMGARGRKGLQTDVYALGAMLYALMTGQAPLAGEESAQVLRRTLEGDIPPPSDLQEALSPGLEAICLRAMEREQEKRYGSVGELLADLQSYRHGFAPKAEEASLGRQLLLLYRRHRPFFLTLGVATVCILGLATFSYQKLQLSEREARQSEAEALEHLAQVQKEQATRNRVEAGLDERLFDQINYHYARQNYEVLKRLIDARLELNAANPQALRRKAMLHLILQEFEAFLTMEGLPEDSLPKEFADLAQFLRSRSQPLGRLSVEELSAFVDQFEERNDRLTERVLSWAFAQGLSIPENLELLERGLRIDNPKLALGAVKWREEGEVLLLENCVHLDDLDFLFHVPITSLSLSGSDIFRIESFPKGPFVRLELRDCELRSIQGMMESKMEILDIRGAKIFKDELKDLGRRKRMERVIVNKGQLTSTTLEVFKEEGIQVRYKDL